MTEKETKVVCVKVADIRKTNKTMDLKKWVEEFPDDHEYIGREGVVFVTRDEQKERYPKRASIWANPYKVGEKQGEYTRDEAIAKYEGFIRGKLEQDPSLIDKLLALKGKELGCWCKPQACHGDVLVKLIQEYEEKISEESAKTSENVKKNNKNTSSSNAKKSTRKWKVAPKTSDNKK